jgi:hypothetical protein
MATIGGPSLSPSLITVDVDGALDGALVGSCETYFVSAVANITNLMPADVNITSVAELYSGRRRLQTLLGVTVNYTLEFAIDDSANSATEINNMTSPVP